ncbi:hypothetical protein Tco_1242917 [Tanacetum coccineum]
MPLTIITYLGTFQHLKLKDVQFHDCEDKSANLFSKCVNLKELTLHGFKMPPLETFTICDPQPSSLTIINAYYFPKVLNVVAPQLKNLTASIQSSLQIQHGDYLQLSAVSIKPIISDFITKAMELPSQDPQESLHFAESLVTFQKYIRSFLGAQLAFGLPLFLTSLFGQTAITLLAAVSYRDKKISLKNLISRMPQASTRLFLTSFQVTLMRVGFFLLGFLVLLVPTIMISDNLLASLVISLVLLIFVVSLYVYFSVVWVLSLVISVLEECSGIEALGKAARLVTGKKFEGFLLFISINLLSYILDKVLSNIIVVQHSELTQEISRVFIGNFLS